jgi:Protein of unknown function (DUF3800)
VFKWLERNNRIGEDVEFIFDRQLNKEEIVRNMFAAFDTIPDKWTKPFGTPAAPQFKDDSDTPALQAADLLAWHIRRGYADNLAGGPQTLSAAMPFLMDPERLCLEEWGDERLRAAALYMTKFSNENLMMTPHQAIWFCENADRLITKANDVQFQ